MYLLVLCMPLIGALALLGCGRWLGRLGASMVVVCGMFCSVLMSCVCLFEINFSGEVCEIILMDWIWIGNVYIGIGFLFDSLTMIMVFIVCFISFWIHVYSYSYMFRDPCLIRYLSYLSIFTFFMLVLVTANNFVQMFIGWEGVGISSYLLISFWYTRLLANKAAVKAMLINRVGDICLLVSIGCIWLFFGTVNYLVVNGILNYYWGDTFLLFSNLVYLLDFVCLFLFFGAMGKSAQLFLHVWLPDAMEGPTPVSALIHAATMVTAGVFLVIRCSFLFELSEFVLLVIIFIGSLTCFFMGIIGIYQNDIKKIVAYSTCSQLGYMFFACGLSNYYISIFHLFNHAFFKALLFLSMGVIIHSIFDEQDLRRMGSMFIFLPLTSFFVFLGSLALLGIPFLAGYYSKDILLESAFNRSFFDGYFSFVLGVLAVACTAFYSTRLFYRVFFLEFTSSRIFVKNIYEGSNFLLIPMMCLMILSICVGYIFFEAFLGVGSIFLKTGIFINIFHYNFLDLEFGVPIFVKWLPFGFTLIGIISYMYYFDVNYFLVRVFRFVAVFFSNSMLFDNLYVKGFLVYFLKMSYFQYYRYVEVGIFPIVFFLVFRNISLKFYKGFSQYTVGKLYVYVALMILSYFYVWFLLNGVFWIDLSVSILSICVLCFFLRPFISWTARYGNGLKADPQFYLMIILGNNFEIFKVFVKKAILHSYIRY